MDADLIVIGAGPAGCAAAIQAVREGLGVILLERVPAPQHKTCGDGLLPDALEALDQLGLGPKIRAEGLRLESLTAFAPGGREIRLAIPAVTLRRQRLHALLQEEALRCGVQLVQGEALGPLRADGRITGVEVRDEKKARYPLSASLTILATGARSGALEDFAVCRQTRPSAVAIRGYYRDLSGEFDNTLHISYDRRLFPGYGWVFPLPGGVFNIGCGRFLSRKKEVPTDLHNMLEFFIRNFPPARAIAGREDLLEVPCGGLLRTGLEGADSHAPGLLVAGEALGATCPFIGDGIGKALETGLWAGQFAAQALEAGDVSADFLARYRDSLEKRYRLLYRGYQRAQRWLAYPRLLDLLAWQAGRRPSVRRALERMLADGLHPGKVFSLSGLLGRVGFDSEEPATRRIVKDSSG
jgi:flavin-dependent dehydrogenase